MIDWVSWACAFALGFMACWAAIRTVMRRLAWKFLIVPLLSQLILTVQRNFQVNNANVSWFLHNYWDEVLRPPGFTVEEAAWREVHFIEEHADANLAPLLKIVPSMMGYCIAKWGAKATRRAIAHLADHYSEESASFNAALNNPALYAVAEDRFKR
jgi:hypothetical protein